MDKDLLVILVRHGERLDKAVFKNGQQQEYKFDPPLTEKGKQQAL